eukprot:COSAG02_NODE_48049_length_336_cov_1.329114_1_plen_22_part_01
MDFLLARRVPGLLHVLVATLLW